jgi:hypothetical protein
MVSPHVGGPAAKRVGRELAFQRGKIKADVKRAAVFRADGLRTGRVNVVATFGAFKVCDLGHELSVTKSADEALS